MKALVIGIGWLGDFVIRSLVDWGSQVEIYTRTQSKYTDYQWASCKWLTSLQDASQPDIIFITANQYQPSDRYSYMKKVHGTGGFIDLRDDEVTKNGPMIEEIWKQLKHLNEVSIIVTANPGIFLVWTLRKILGWDAVYGMMSMLDNKRVADRLWTDESNILTIWEHGRSTLVIDHVFPGIEEKIYHEIDNALEGILDMAYKGKGIPNYEAPFLQLRRIIHAVWTWNELICVLEWYQDDLGVVTWMSYTIQWTGVVRQGIPVLSVYEEQRLWESIERIKRKWLLHFK